MMQLAILVGTLLWLCFLSAPALAAEPSAVWSSLKTLRSEILNGTVVRARIFYRSFRVETPGNVTPERLESCWDNETVEISSNLKYTLIAAIDITELHPANYRPDVHWGAVFIDKSERRIHSIYLNRINHTGLIDGTGVGLNGAIMAWFEVNFLDELERESLKDKDPPFCK